MKIRMLSIILAGTLLFSVNPGQAESAQRNGFSIEDPIIPLADILSGGPPRDGIPSIDSPKFISASEVDWLLPGSRILGLEINGVIRAYPLAILNCPTQRIFNRRSNNSSGRHLERRTAT